MEPTPISDVPDVIVVGTGYAGVMAANRLANHRRSVVVVTDSTEFVDRIRLHQLIAGSRDSMSRPLRDSLRPSIRTVAGRAMSAVDGVVTLADGRVLSARQVIWATGSTPRSVEPTWIPVGSLAGAEEARDRLAALPAGAVVTVRGGGLTGVETATEIAERRPDLTIHLDDPHGPVSRLPREARDHVTTVLDRGGVKIVSGTEAADLDLDCTGFAAQPIAVDDLLRADQRLWGVGDAARVTGLPYQRMSCAMALPMAAHAADNVHRVLSGREPKPFDFGFKFQCISLGRRDGLIVWVGPGDRPTGRIWTGRRAAVTKELICRMAESTPRSGGRMYRWPRGPR